MYLLLSGQLDMGKGSIPEGQVAGQVEVQRVPAALVVHGHQAAQHADGRFKHLGRSGQIALCKM